MPVDVSANPHFYLLLGALLVAAIVARRVPLLRTLVSLAVWGGLAVLLAAVCDLAVLAAQRAATPWQRVARA